MKYSPRLLLATSLTFGLLETATVLRDASIRNVSNEQTRSYAMNVMLQR